MLSAFKASRVAIAQTSLLARKWGARTCATASVSSISESSSEGYAELTKTGNGVGVITLTSDDIGGSLAKDLEQAVNRVFSDQTLKSVVLIGAAPGKFLSSNGVDLMTGKTPSQKELMMASSNWQEILNRIEKSNIPFVAAVDGLCEGAGLDLVLACHSRVATDSPKTKFAFTEVMSGRLPVGGGTQRLPKLVGIEESMKMLLAGGAVRASKGKKIHLVDRLVQPVGLGLKSAQENTYNNLYTVARAEAERMGAKPMKSVVRKKDFVSTAKETLMTHPKIALNLVLKKARDAVMKKTFGNYPAPLAILDCVEAGYKQGPIEGKRKEVESYTSLSVGEESLALRSLFDGQKQCAVNRYVNKGEPKPSVDKVAILGAGLMGSGIAQVSIQNAKHKVWLLDRSADAAALGVNRVEDVFRKRVRKKTMTQMKCDTMLSELKLTTDVTDLKSADIIIEAVFEDLGVKQEMIRKTEAVTSDKCIFASNTSALPITDIAKASKWPQNVIGMHYFSPVPAMPLLEVITHEGTSQSTVATAVQVGLDQGKTVIVVKDGPGFYTTRVLAPLLTECMVLMAEGNDFKKIDKLMQTFGFPVGPVTLFDEVGIDVGCHVAADLGQRLPRLSQGDVATGVAAMNEMMEKGWVGRKSQAGLYTYSGKKKSINEDAIALFKRHGAAIQRTTEDADLPLRMACRMANEAVMCLQEGVLAKASDGDVGAVFGLGFPPAKGGPFRWLDTYGAQNVVDHLDRFRETFGEQFTVCDLLRENAKSEKKFY